MKILFILEYYYPHIGGVETLFKALVDSLIQKGHTVTILTNKHEEELLELESEDRLTVRRIPLKNRYLFTFFSVRHAIRLARDHDLIHTTSYNAGIPAIIAAKITGTKSIITFHEVWYSLWFKLPWISKISACFHFLFEYILLKMPFDRFIGVSEFTAKALVDFGIKERKVERIYNGIDYTHITKKPKRSKEKGELYKFLYFGRMGISKGLDVLMEALQLLNLETTKFVLTLVIPEEPIAFRKKVDCFINENDLSKRVKIRSNLSRMELEKEIHSSDCVVIPSYSEGFCFAAVETMALEIPIISSGQGALAEVVSGLHLHFNDMSPLSLKEKMISALNEEWDYKEPNQFHLEDSVCAYIGLYQSLL